MFKGCHVAEGAVLWLWNNGPKEELDVPLLRIYEDETGEFMDDSVLPLLYYSSMLWLDLLLVS